ncbi:ATP-binding protein [Streptomyces sp. CAU 1734]|uniref:ATP-binding protein n=1 Tax=Streptomyces sp. CAU 1734 TaxID=3140360 RepID=UPI003261868B
MTGRQGGAGTGGHGGHHGGYGGYGDHRDRGDRGGRPGGPPGIQGGGGRRAQRLPTDRTAGAPPGLQNTPAGSNAPGPPGVQGAPAGGAAAGAPAAHTIPPAAPMTHGVSQGDQPARTITPNGPTARGTAGFGAAAGSLTGQDGWRRTAPAESAGLYRRLGCADLKSVPEVRGMLREMLRQWQGSDAADVAQLLASELVTNALIHTDHGAVVTATVASSVLRVEVRDGMPGLPVADPPGTAGRDPLDVHGRGLVLVRSLADSWGVRTLNSGKVVWFEVRERPAR